MMSKKKTILSAENGPVIGADDTGIVLNLSDRVIRDIMRRMAAFSDPALLPQAVDAVPAWLADDIDWWNAQACGDWTHFDARLQGTADNRRYARHVSGPGIVADAPGALRAMISLAGPRRYTLRSSPPDYPFHVIACPPPEPGEAPLFANSGHCGIDSDICDALVRRRQAGFRRLPIHVAQPCLLPANGPLDGADLTELTQFLTRLAALAKAMGKAARITAISLEVGPQHLGAGSDAQIMHVAALRLLDRVAAKIRAVNMGDAPVFLTFDAGAWWSSDQDAAMRTAEAIQRLILCPGIHRIVPIGSTAGLAQDMFAMPTQIVAARQAACEAWSIDAAQDVRFAGAPVLYLAERVDALRIRAMFKTTGGLAIDDDRRDQTGPGAGFSVTVADTHDDLPIAAVEPDPDDPGALLIAMAGDMPDGHKLRLNHALPRRSDDCTGYAATSIFQNEEPALQDAASEGPRFWAMPASMVVR